MLFTLTHFRRSLGLFIPLPPLLFQDQYSALIQRSVTLPEKANESFIQVVKMNPFRQGEPAATMSISKPDQPRILKIYPRMTS